MHGANFFVPWIKDMRRKVETFNLLLRYSKFVETRQMFDFLLKEGACIVVARGSYFSFWT